MYQHIINMDNLPIDNLTWDRMNVIEGHEFSIGVSYELNNELKEVFSLSKSYEELILELNVELLFELKIV